MLSLNNVLFKDNIYNFTNADYNLHWIYENSETKREKKKSLLNAN